MRGISGLYDSIRDLRARVVQQVSLSKASDFREFGLQTFAVLGLRYNQNRLNKPRSGASNRGRRCSHLGLEG